MSNKTGLRFTIKAGTLPEDSFAVAGFTLDERPGESFTPGLNPPSSRPGIGFAAVPDR